MIKILVTALVLILVVIFIATGQDQAKVSESTSSGTAKDNGTTGPSGVEITEIDESVLNSNSVTDLSNQGLKEVPGSVFDRTGTIELDLSNNLISGSLQAEVRHLQNLRVLDLSNNQFTGVPAEIGQLKNLEVLNLANNQLTGLPHELGNLANLKVLDLRGNNYAEADLEVIKKGLPASVEILTSRPQ